MLWVGLKAADGDVANLLDFLSVQRCRELDWVRARGVGRNEQFKGLTILTSVRVDPNFAIGTIQNP
jgi:hypothetical protein